MKRLTSLAVGFSRAIALTVLYETARHLRPQDAPRMDVRDMRLPGASLGVGGVVLPGPSGLGEAPGSRTPQTRAMTVTWYTVGKLAADTVARVLRK